jgi:hypothetical protein
MSISTATEFFYFPIFVFTLILNCDFVVSFFNVITYQFSKTIVCNKPNLNILFNNENIAIFVNSDLDLSSRSMGGYRS